MTGLQVMDFAFPCTDGLLVFQIMQSNVSLLCNQISLLWAVVGFDGDSVMLLLTSNTHESSDLH